jgi:hypothetical protein
VDFRVDGLTIEKMGLAGVRADQLQNILNNGFSDL